MKFAAFSHFSRHSSSPTLLVFAAYYDNANANVVSREAIISIRTFSFHFDDDNLHRIGQSTTRRSIFSHRFFNNSACSLLLLLLFRRDISAKKQKNSTWRVLDWRKFLLQSRSRSFVHVFDTAAVIYVLHWP